MRIAQETSIKIDGVDYKLSKFTLPLYQEFLDWAKSKLPDPYAGIAERVKGLPDNLAKHLIDRAEERAAKRGTLNDPETNALVESPEGLRKVFALLFRKYQPSLTEDQVISVVERGVEEHGEEFFRNLFPKE